MSVQQEQVGLMSAAEGTTRRPPISTSPASHSAAAPNLNTQHVRAMPSPRDATPLLSVPLSHPLAGQPEGAGIGDRPPHRGTTSSTATPGSSRQSPTPPKKPAAVKRQRGWWWWEIGACLLSIISTTLLFVLLTRVADSTLESWPYQIQINSVIATLTAVSRTALLVPIAACISQLKWGHFERPNRLSHLQDFDDASRGPWGSLLLLFKINLREYLVWALSLCTVLSLGIGPSAQQILDFPSRRVLLLNATAEMAQAPAYAAKEPFTIPPPENSEVAPDRLFFPPKVALPFQAKVRSGLMGAAFAPDFLCPPGASECTWDDFTTLGLCADVRNVTADAAVRCNPSTEDGGFLAMVCDYTYVQKSNETHSVRMTFISGAIPIPSFITLSSDPSPTGTTRTTRKSTSTPTAVSSPPSPRPTTPVFTSPEESEVVVSILPISIRDAAPTQVAKRQLGGGSGNGNGTLHNSYDSLAVRLRPEALFPGQVSINPSYIESGQSPPVDVFYFAWEWCEKTLKDVSSSNGKLRIGNITTTRLQPLESQATTIMLTGYSDLNMALYGNAATGTRYQVGQASGARLEQLRDMFFTQAVSATGNTMDGALDFGMFVYQSDFAALVRNHADTVDNMLHTWEANMNVTNQTGRAFSSETFIRVRWPWIILPVAEAAGAAVLLALSIFATRHQPLLKDSALALLFYGPGKDEWPEEAQVQRFSGNGRPDARVYEKSAKGMIASLEEDNEGRMGFRTSSAK